MKGKRKEEDAMRMKRGFMAVLVLSILLMAQGTTGQGVSDKAQVAFNKDEMGYVFLASGVNLRNYDTVVIGDFSIAGLPDIGPEGWKVIETPIEIILRINLRQQRYSKR
jgi:hypothetical protein